ncbi:hypothetical protein FGO68_gene13480 [Halteria grandinella]|uniref:Uncharacterized protein n=1 Tax=Halteria grandinella TaxID=5974 RepID=A0A8J8NZV5_HALGN|nr:hypothetical protein FGO68_gene13480 [Halteria grandinella]
MSTSQILFAINNKLLSTLLKKMSSHFINYQQFADAWSSMDTKNIKQVTILGKAIKKQRSFTKYLPKRRLKNYRFNTPQLKATVSSICVVPTTTQLKCQILTTIKRYSKHRLIIYQSSSK